MMDRLILKSRASGRGENVMGSKLRIPYVAEGFPLGTALNGMSELDVSWNDILWAALTVGRPNRQYVFRHGDASRYEAIFRLSLVRMTLEQSRPRAYRLRRTNAARTLDPTEKGAVNYFLGMTLCKLFADKLLNTPWLLHLDVFRPQLNAVLTGRSRPDLVGKEYRTNTWHAFECKGRVSPPGPTAKRRAKEQATRLTSVNGIPCSLHVGAISFFRGEALNFYWLDPDPEKGNLIEVPYNGDAWRHYYAPIIGLFSEADRERVAGSQLIEIQGLDLKVGVHPAIAQHLFKNEWRSAQEGAEQIAAELTEMGYNRDGIMVKAGDSWLQSFDDTGLSENGMIEIA
jgi:hypothetical protein